MFAIRAKLGLTPKWVLARTPMKEADSQVVGMEYSNKSNGYERWSVKMCDEQRITAFEMLAKEMSVAYQL